MKHVQILAVLATKKLLFSSILGAIFVSFFLSVVHTSTVGATPYTDEYSDITTKIKAVKYYGLVKTCTTDTPGAYGGAIKTTISGTDIDNGPRWWTTSFNSGGINIGVFIDGWGDKNGVTDCNGESDSEPGWLNDMFKIYGQPVPSKTANGGAARRDFLHNVLGYTCTKQPSQWECTNPHANDDASQPDSWLARLKATPYLGGQDPLTVSPDNNAMTYYLALQSLKNPSQCKAQQGGSGNLVKVAEVQTDGSVVTSDWSVKNDGGPGRVANSGLPLTPQNTWGTGGKTCQDMADYTVKYKADYIKWAGRQACASAYPANASDLTFLSACAQGWANPTDYVACSKYPAAGYSGSTFSSGGRNACFLGQGLPIDKDGVTAGELCMALGFSTQQDLAACINGAINRDDPAYCGTTYYTGYHGSTFENHDAEAEACKNGQALKVTDGTAVVATIPGGFAGTSGHDDATSCVVDGIGWLVCPLMNALGGLTDAMYAWVQSVLVLNPLQQSDSNGVTPQYQTWSLLRNIANVLLVIGFLVIIFSQISSIGISNYGVKKMLPRIIIVAVAINLSWTIMTLAVDVVNVVGVGLNTLIESSAVDVELSKIDITSLVSALVAGTTATLAVAFILPVTGVGLSTLVLLALPFLLGAALSLLAAVATLFIRNALVIVLVIVSPVAIALYMLPNTEEYFKKWRQLFTSMLLLFPMAAVLFAGCKFAAYVILSANQPMGPIIAVFIMAAPLGLLPWLARSSGGILSAVNGKLGSWAKSAQGAAQKGLAQRVATQRAEYKAGTRNFFGRENNSGRRTRAQKWSDRRQGLKTREGTAEKVIVQNYKQIGLNGNRPVVGTPRQRRRIARQNAQAARVAAVVDASHTADLNEKAINEQYGTRLKERQLRPGSIENRITKNLEDAEATSHVLDGRLKTENLERIQTGDVNTVAAAVGVAGDPTLLRLDHVSEQANIESHANAALEAEVQRTNDEAGSADLWIERENEAKFGSEVKKSETDATFADEKNTRADLVDLANRKDIADKAKGAAEHELESKVEGEAERGLDSREANKLRQQRAEEELATFKADEDAKLAERRRPGGDLYGLTAAQQQSKLEQERAQKATESATEERKTEGGDLAGIQADIERSEEEIATSKSDQDAILAARREPGGDLYGLTREQEESKLKAERSQARQKEAFEERKTPEGDLASIQADIDTATVNTEEQQAKQADELARRKGVVEAEGGLMETADRTAGIKETTAGREARAKAKIDAAKVGMRDEAGRLKPIVGLDATVQEQLAAAGREQAIAARNSSLASGIAEVVRGKEVNADPTGALARDMAGIDLALNENTNLEAANAAKITEADLEGDRKAFDDLHKRKGYSSTDLYHTVLGVADPTVAITTIKSSDDLPLAEELSAVGMIIQYGGADDQDDLFNYSSALTRAARDAEDAADAAEAAGSPDAPELRKKAATARFRSKTIHSAMQRGWAQFGGQRPMQYGGSVEQTLAQDTETRTKYQIQADRLGGGKYDHTMGSQNIDRLKALQRQIKSYEGPAGATRLADDFREAYRVGAEWEVTERDHIPRSDPGWSAAVDAAILRKTAQAPDNLSLFLTQLDKALDDPRSPALTPEKRTTLEETRTSLIKVLGDSGISLPEVPEIDPATRKERRLPDGSVVMGPYRRRAKDEYNPGS